MENLLFGYLYSVFYSFGVLLLLFWIVSLHLMTVFPVPDLYHCLAYVGVLDDLVESAVFLAVIV